MEEKFNDIIISTETIIAKTNWKVDINALFNHLFVTDYTVIPKKRGRKSKNEKNEEVKQQDLKDGQIVTLKIGSKLKGVNLKEKKNAKRFFRNSLTVVMFLDNKFINFKVSKNGKFQFTGCKNVTQSQSCMKFIHEYTKNTTKIINVDGDSEIIFLTVMTNINFNLGFCINREYLDDYINSTTKYYSLLETSFGYTGVNIKFPLQNINNMPITKILFKDDQWQDHTMTYQEYLETLDDKEQKKESIKTRYNTFLVFQSGNVILSSPHKECMRKTYHDFLQIIAECRHKIEEKFD